MKSRGGLTQGRPGGFHASSDFPVHEIAGRAEHMRLYRDWLADVGHVRAGGEEGVEVPPEPRRVLHRDAGAERGLAEDVQPLREAAGRGVLEEVRVIYEAVTFARAKSSSSAMRPSTLSGVSEVGRKTFTMS